MLRCEDPETNEDDILTDFEYEMDLSAEDCVAFYEHGQWWVEHKPTGAQWSVNDLERDGEDKFCFEQVTLGEED